jgi:Tfp pilus assembly protein PilF
MDIAAEYVEKAIKECEANERDTNGDILNRCGAFIEAQGKVTRAEQVCIVVYIIYVYVYV